MNALNFPLLSVIIWLPALGALLLLLVPRDQEQNQRRLALGFSLATLAAVALLIYFFEYAPISVQTVNGQPIFQFVDLLPWIPAFGMNYLVGVDGTNLWLVLLTAFLTPVAIVAAGSITQQVRYFMVLALLMETALLGVFCALDLVLFYIFWEFTLIPMAFLIGIWGGERRVYAATRFFLFTFAGSVLMLLSIIGLYFLHREALAASDPNLANTFDLRVIVGHMRSGAFSMDVVTERLLLLGFLAAFAVKVPLWPFHTWLPDAYSEFATPVVVLLAGVMAKLGTYGMLRYNVQLFPDSAQWVAPAVGILAVLAILYGAITAFAQTDMKRLVAYSSFSHMGFIALGVFSLTAEGISGAILQMVNHGITTSALFLIVAFLAARRGSYALSGFGGLWKVTPIFGGLALVSMLASMGLPGLNGFIGEYTMMQGTLSSRQLGWPFVGFAVIGVILAAAYLLRMFRLTFMGEASTEVQGFAELDNRELTLLMVLVIPMVVLGLAPNLLFEPMRTSVADIVNALGTALAGR